MTAMLGSMYIITGFCSGRLIPASPVSIKMNIKKYNLFRFRENNKSKTIKAINLNQRLKVAIFFK